MSSGGARGEVASRDQVLVDGYLKRREAGTLVYRWRHRYVVFKVTTSGKLTFTVYKDKPPTPSNELYELPIEDYGGTDSNVKIDGEKNVFAILLTDSTECFATESPNDLKRWTRTLNEYLGKELVLSINVPHKQNILKQGRAFIRIRNNGFTISTADTPPRCQGSWQILHIRKFGGSKSFKFETGSKCPLGESTYELETDELEKIKSVFTDLSMHKPIFNDDRTGRRMTTEHGKLTLIREHMNNTTGGHPQVNSTRSLQGRSQKYENFSSQRPLFERGQSLHKENRYRSNAIIREIEREPLFQTLPLPQKRSPHPPPTDTDNVHYYNFRAIEQFAPPPPPPPPSLQRVESDPPQERHLYYNHCTFESLPARKRKDSCDESDEEDFVDVQHMVNGHPSYSNSSNEDSLYVNGHAHLSSTHDPVLYSNGTHVSDHTHSGNDHTHQSDSSYYNLAIQNETEEQTHQLSYENVTPTQSLHTKPVAHSRLVKVNGDTAHHNVQDGDTAAADDEEGSHLYFNLPIMSELKQSSSVECFHIPKVPPTNKSVPPPQVARKRLNSSSSSPNLCELVETDEDTKSPTESKFKSSENIAIAKTRPQQYDHLVPSANGSSEKLKFSPPKEPRQSPSPPSVFLKGAGQAPPQPVVWNRRPHTYEDVELDEEDGCGSLSSPSEVSIDEEAVDPYKRKVSLLGHEHSYEYIQVQKSNKQQEPHPQPRLSSSSSSPPEPLRKISSPSRSISPRGNPATILKSRPLLPMQKERAESEATPTRDTQHRRSAPETRSLSTAGPQPKKPIPPPRKPSDPNLKKPRSSIDKELVELSANRSKSPSHRVHKNPLSPEYKAKPSHPLVPPKPDWIKNPQTSPQAEVPAPPLSSYRSKILHGLPHQSPTPAESNRLKKEETRKPAVPPKKRDSRDDLVSDMNYIPVILPEESKLKPHEIGTGKFQIKRVLPEDISVNYCDVDHFLTHQIKEMREEREMEKGFVNL